MTASSRRRKSPRWAAWAGAMMLSATAATAGPEARVRVRGSSRLEATATATPDGFVLKGALLEDAGRPVAGARVRVRQLAPEGSTRLLRHPEPCTQGLPDGNEPTHGSEEVSLTTDGAGRFCARWPSELPSGSLVLAFDDARGLLDSAEKSVEVQRLAPFELDFARPPRTLSLDAPEVVLEIHSRARAGADVTELPLALLWTRAGAPTTTLLARSLRPGESATVRVPTRDLGGPGPGELRARLGQGEQAAEAHTQIVATASVRLEVEKAVTAAASGEGSLLVGVSSAVGEVSTGSIEALVGERTVGIAPVSGGEAAVPMTLGAGPLTASVTLRYLPASPWWLAGPPESVVVTVPRASAWRHVFWAAALAAIATYIAAAWRRPPRHSNEQRALRTSPLESPALRWTPPAKGVEGWLGTVTDAHDGSPVAGATVVLSSGSDEERRAVTEPDGSFHFTPLTAARNARLRVEADWHSPFDGELPPQGFVSIALWTRRRGPPWAGVGEPTPGELARAADARAEENVATWARAVEAAAFGPVAVDPAEEARVRALEPEPSAEPVRPREPDDPM